MNILKASRPQSNDIQLTLDSWHMPYNVGSFIELEDKVILCFSWSEMKKNPPKPGFYHGCTIWCYEKKTKEIKWVIEEPPIIYNKEGKPVNRGGPGPFDKYFKKKSEIYECYLDISYSKHDDQLTADTTGARRFIVNPDTGKVTLIEGLHPKLF